MGSILAGKHRKKSKLSETIESSLYIMIPILIITLFVIVLFLFPSSKKQNDKLDTNKKTNSNYISDNIALKNKTNDKIMKTEQVPSIYSYMQSDNIKAIHTLSAMDTIYSCDINSPYLSITFDDCPSGEMEKILDLLDEYDMKCTFFVIGEYVKNSDGWVKEMINRGHTVGNHSYDHPSFKRISDNKILEQINDTDDLIKKETDEKVSLIRPPYGSTTDEVTKMLNQQGYSLIMWNIDSLDWKLSAKSAYKRASKADKGDIVLFHTGKANLHELKLYLQKIKTKD